MVIFVRLRRRQFFTRDVKLEAIEPLGILARGNAFQRRHEVSLGLADMRHLEAARAVFGGERAVARHRQRIFRERPQFDGAAHAVRRTDSRDADRGH